MNVEFWAILALLFQFYKNLFADDLPALNVVKLHIDSATAAPNTPSLSSVDVNTHEDIFAKENFPPVNDSFDEMLPLAEIFSLNSESAPKEQLALESLREAAFETVLDDEFAQHVNGLKENDCLPKMDLVFLLDTSGSIEQLYQEHVRWAVAFVESLPIEKDTVCVAAVPYANFPMLDFALGTYPSTDDIRRHRDGATRAVAGYAMRKAQAELFRNDRGARNDAKKVLVLFTDGHTVEDLQKPAQEMRDLNNVKIYVFTTGLDGELSQKTKRIAGQPENVFGPDDLQRLRDVLIGEAERARACTRIGALKSYRFQDHMDMLHGVITSTETVRGLADSSGINTDSDERKREKIGD